MVDINDVLLLVVRISCVNALPCRLETEEENAQRGGVFLQSYKGLAEVAILCICELLVALPHFNFHNNIIVMVVPLMNDPIKRVSLE